VRPKSEDQSSGNVDDPALWELGARDEPSYNDRYKGHRAADRSGLPKGCERWIAATRKASGGQKHNNLVDDLFLGVYHG
jgi:hypothetical protein